MGRRRSGVGGRWGRRAATCGGFDERNRIRDAREQIAGEPDGRVGRKRPTDGGYVSPEGQDLYEPTQLGLIVHDAQSAREDLYLQVDFYEASGGSVQSALCVPAGTLPAAREDLRRPPEVSRRPPIAIGDRRRSPEAFGGSV